MRIRIWLSLLMAAVFAANAPAQQKITINYPNRSGSNWPLFLAKEGDYYQKYGLDVTLTFGVMPTGIAMLVSNEAQMVKFVAGTIDAGGVEGRLHGVDRERSQSRSFRVNGEEGNRVD